jgi:hypothetical protein
MVASPSSRERAPYDAAVQFAVGFAYFGVIAGVGSLVEAFAPLSDGERR